MATSSNSVAAVYLGDVEFGKGGVNTKYLIGEFIKNIVKDSSNNYEFSYQDTSGTAHTITISSTSHYHIGTGTPSSSLGVDQDVYLDSDNGDFFQKGAGSWGNSVYSFGTGGGIDQSAVDARVKAGVADFAETGNNSNISASKLPAPTTTTRGAPLGITNAILDAATSNALFAWGISHVKRAINAIVQTWAKVGNDDVIPNAKLGPAYVDTQISGAELRFQRGSGENDTVITLPDGGGGGTLTPPESLYDNFDDASSPLTIGSSSNNTQGTWSSTNSIAIDLGRDIVAADDGHSLEVDMRWEQDVGSGGEPRMQTKRATWRIDAREFRRCEVNALTNRDVPEGWTVSILRPSDQGNNDLQDSHTRMVILTRGRTTDGNDSLRITTAGTPENIFQFTDIRIKVILHIPQSGVGPPGPTGADGAAGADGTPGGPVGPTGPAGAAGTAGQNGAAGVAGAAGSDGMDGAPGAAGAAGMDGTDGEDGTPGGPPGPAGADGVAGMDGMDGADGTPGGPPGPAGPAGADGVAGIDGADGPAGPAGSGSATSLIGRGVITASFNSGVDTGIDMPSVIGDDELFAVMIENTTTRQHSGAFTFSGQAWKALTDWPIGQGEGSANCFAMDQGDNTDDEFFVGHDDSGNVLISSDSTGASDDVRVSMWKVGVGPKGDTGPAGPGGGGLTGTGLPTHTAAETDRYPITTAAVDGWALRRGAPPALPGHPHRVVSTNAAGTAYELSVPLSREDVYPHVTILPDYLLAGSPELVFLEHDVVTGVRNDATLTLGAWTVGAETYVGYTVNTVSGSGGTINRTSPLVEIFGGGTLASYALTQVWSLNKDWLDSFTHIVINSIEFPLQSSFRSGASTWIRDIQGGPVGYSAASLSLNFKRSDGTHYFVGGSGIISATQGLYEKLAHGYSRFASTGFSHDIGRGAPTHEPDYGGQQFVNELGKLWVAASEILVVTTPAIGTNVIFANDKYVRDPDTRADVLADGGDGGFYWVDQLGDPNFEQFLGTAPGDLDSTRSWNDLWLYIYGVTGQNTTANLRIRDHSQFLGGFANAQAAYDALGLLTEQTAFDLAATDYYFGLTQPNAKIGIWKIETWTAPVLDATDHLRWNGPFLTEEDVAQLIEEDASGSTTENEVLFDNRADASGLSCNIRTAGAKWSSSNHISMLLTRLLTTSDDNFDMQFLIDYQVEAQGFRRYVTKIIPAKIIRTWRVNSQGSGAAQQDGEAVYVCRTGTDALNQFGEMFLAFTRGRNPSGTIDRIRIGIGLNTQADTRDSINDWRATITLLPGR